MVGPGSLFRDLPMQPSVPEGSTGLDLFLEMAGEEDPVCLSFLEPFVLRSSLQ